MVPMGNPYQMGGSQSLPQPYLNGNPYSPNQYIGGPDGLFDLNTMLPLNHNPFVNTQLPFLDTLELFDLSKLTNNSILHHPSWLPVSVKISTNIPKFEAKIGENPVTHITTYHLWCVSNFMLDDSIKLHLLPCTFSGNVTKWFIELPTFSFCDFGSLAMAFLTHFQLPICYEMGINILTSFC